MNLVSRVSRVAGTLLIVLILLSKTVSAATAPILAVPTGLSIAELKITGSEFVMLMNNSGSDIDDLSQYWLYNFNKTNPLASGVSSSTEQLPAASLLNGQTVLLSEGGPTCGAAVTDNLSLSLTDSGGFLEVVKIEMIDGTLVQTSGDAVSWSSSSNPAPGMISKVPSSSNDPNGAWYRYQNTSSSPAYLWQQADTDSTNVCQLNVTLAGAVLPGPSDPGTELIPGTPPPATIISVASTSEGSSNMPAGDIGLMAPVLNELLPNPASPQTDAKDEFVELYNPNIQAFDLSGFKLQTKSSTSSTKYTYTFPSGTIIAGRAFAAYPSSNISISLSNSGAQVWLLDPASKIISQTDVYKDAKDGQAWALANGKWYWTSTPTPSAANVIKAASSSSKTGKGVGTIKGASIGTNSGNSGLSDPASLAQQPAPLHSSVLVGVGALALLYGIYEYRQDIANALYRAKRYRTVRRENRAQS